MFEIDKKNFKKRKKPAILLLFFGLIFVAVGAFLPIRNMIEKGKLDMETKATGVIENGHYDDEGSYMYSPIFTYRVRGEEYSCKSSVSSSFKPSTDTTIYYSSKDPSKCLSSYESKGDWLFLIFIGVGAVIMGCGVFMLVKTNGSLKKAKELANNGKLIKNMPYRLEGTNTYINGRNVQKIVVDYIMPNGTIKTCVGDPRYDLKTGDEDGLVDLLIDPNNPDNYYLDFDIQYKEGANVEFYKDPLQSNVAVQEQPISQPVSQPVEQVQTVQQPVVQNNNAQDDLSSMFSQSAVENNNQQINQ